MIRRSNRLCVNWAVSSARGGNALVYGGSKNGLMGALAESVLRAGGEVTGVEPQLFIDKGSRI